MTDEERRERIGQAFVAVRDVFVLPQACKERMAGRVTLFHAVHLRDLFEEQSQRRGRDTPQLRASSRAARSCGRLRCETMTTVRRHARDQPDGPAPKGGDILHAGWSIVDSVVLDREFFMREFALRVQRFSAERDSLPVRVVISTTTGRDFDIERIATSNAGIALYTREDKMILLPYSAIEHVEISVAQDRRLQGFEIPAESELDS